METIDNKINEARRNIIYFDLETQKSAQEVGGWSYIDRMKLAVAVTFSTADQQYTTFQESDVELLINQLATADCIVGFNLKAFDYLVLRAYTRVNLWGLPTFDMLETYQPRPGISPQSGCTCKGDLARGQVSGWAAIRSMVESRQS